MGQIQFALIIIISFNSVFSVRIVTPGKENPTLQVETVNGIIQGEEKTTSRNKTYFSYLGIPFAQPPVNNLRFRAPQPSSNWSGILDASQYAPCCLGVNTKTLMNLRLTPLGMEDCLYLNVFRPKVINGKLPVMVFFYGGGFISGCPDMYGPEYLMLNDVILVVPAYRLSIFGFLSTADEECPGNWATKDNIAALQWVHSNIEKFGGDAQNVTIFGQSSGAVLVNILLMAPQAAHLFHKAILMSGTTLGFWGIQTEPRAVAFDMGKAVGLKTNNSTELLTHLRSMDANSLINSSTTPLLAHFILFMQNGLPVAPVVEPIHDGAVLTNYTYSLIENGNFTRVPIMLGTLTLEAACYYPIILQLKPMLPVFDISPGSLPRLSKDLKKRRIAGKMIIKYLLNGSASNADIKDILLFFTEDAYWRPTKRAAQLFSKYVPVYFYQFSFATQLGQAMLTEYADTYMPRVTEHGVGHGEDMAFIFSTDFSNPTERDWHFIIKFTKTLTNFAKFGNPTPHPDVLLNNLTWQPVRSSQVSYVNFDDEFTQHADFKEKSTKFWDYLYDKYADKPYKIY